jgi:hypothetical protein
VEVIIYWKKTIGFELTEDSTQFLLETVHGMKKVPAIHVELPAAQFPVGAEEEMILEDTVLLCG